MRVKICGITNYEDAAAALDVGADALGFNFSPPSPRYIEPSIASSIIRRLPPLTVCVGVFVNHPNAREVLEVSSRASVQVIQLHGDERPEYCRELSPWPLIKALRLDGHSIPHGLSDFPVGAFLLDSRDDVRFGGTGNTFDWDLCNPIRKIRPMILAGGLHAGNIREAARSVRPYGVDICSGVESSPGKKDKNKLADLMSEVRNAVSEIGDR